MMGRKLMRVSLDFSWERKTWKGYINPYPPFNCDVCGGSGLNEATEKLSNDWYTHLRTDGQEGWSCHLEQEDVDALIEEERLWDFTREPRNSWQFWVVWQKQAAGGNSWLPFDNGYRPTAAEINFWSRQGFGHDSLNQCICVRARAKRMGIYGLCEKCNGDGYYFANEGHRSLSENWEPSDPPTGEGFQLWETTSEGSPISPVFKSLEALCAWCEKHASPFGGVKISKEEWLQMLQEDLVYYTDEQGNVFL
jgi:hypothetical protein